MNAKEDLKSSLSPDCLRYLGQVVHVVFIEGYGWATVDCDNVEPIEPPPWIHSYATMRVLEPRYHSGKLRGFRCEIVQVDHPLPDHRILASPSHSSIAYDLTDNWCPLWRILIGDFEYKETEYGNLAEGAGHAGFGCVAATREALPKTGYW